MFIPFFTAVWIIFVKEAEEREKYISLLPSSSQKKIDPLILATLGGFILAEKEKEKGWRIENGKKGMAMAVAVVGL